ncbi:MULTISPECIES: hypothetical protein [Bacillus cereus group]|uniref:Lipoprotein n=2 Tax=Bacillus cereus group TaxID=86661 RepID=A0A9X6XV62_BACCE|nr:MULTISPECIES: hypothetical protein [Bacillus cereus group]MDA1675208.1 hypothetical protein [Bacillus cereus group sp. TH152-1LC]PDZ93981.1 hypothetical protein CON36_36270 [Bacillus cereus]PFJ32303.1 hypothetical protein COJ15_28960 [Bacillus thuringiensis]PGP12037.1 hypothetical protein COA01_35030 [Bacillus cereus]
MKKMMITVLLTAIVTIMSACSGAANSMQATGKHMSSSNYLLVKQSGGKVVESELVIDKVVNSEKDSDGWFYIIPKINNVDSGNDKLYNRMGGDVSVREVPTQQVLDYYMNYYNLKPEMVINYEKIK